ADQMAAAMRAGYANPASQHEPGRRARRELEEARHRIGELLGARMSGRDPDRVIFTSGGTEANHLAIRGIALGSSVAGNAPPEIVVSAIEHPSAVAAAESLEREGWRVERLRPRRDGVIDLHEFGSLLSPATRLVSVMLGNNETGVLQPVAEIARRCHAAGVLVHTDAGQAVGKSDVSLAALGADAMSLTAPTFQ